MTRPKRLAKDGEKKRCNKCGVYKEFGEYYRVKTGLFGLHARCKACVSAWHRARYAASAEHREYVGRYRDKWKDDNPERKRFLSRKSHIKKKYGLLWDEYLQMCEAQGNCCAICSRNVRLLVDHDHATGKIRGLICHRCNTGLGQFQDSAKLIRRANAYLTKDKRTAKNIRKEDGRGLFDQGINDVSRVQ